MKYDEPKGDWVKLPKPWSELRPGLREEVAAKAVEIHTYDGGQLMRVDGQWEVMASGDRHDADLIVNILRKPN